MSDHPAPTERLTFRRWRDDDLPLARQLFGDPQVTALVGGPFDDTTIAARLATELANQRDHRIAYWPIFMRAGGTFAGCAGLKPKHPERNIVELGFYLRPACWGAGYAVEASRSVITFAFDVLGAASLFAGHHPQNASSRRTLETLGFRYKHDELYPPTGLDHPGYELVRS